jgi:hypothetical protein
MTARLAMTIMGLVIGPALGDGVKEAKKLISESKKDEVEAMKVLDLVTGDLTEKGVDEVIVWVIENGFAEERKRVGEVIWSLPKNDQLMLKYVRVLGFYGEKQQLEAVIGKLPKGRVQQEARFRLAMSVAEDAQRDLTLTDAERAAGNQEAVGILEKLGKEEGLNESLEKRVADLRYKVTHLVVGCEAPEIEGVDHDGKQFRLSEFRGKVVLLPFWGFW